MQVILREKVVKLGNVGDIVDVKSGYSRNYLIPKGLAVRATPANLEEFEKYRAELEKKEAEKLQQAQQRAEKLKETVVTITAKASEEGKLFGSINPREISLAAEAMGVELCKSEIRLPEGPIRLVGEYEVAVILHGEVQADIKIVIVAEK